MTGKEEGRRRLVCLRNPAYLSKETDATDAHVLVLVECAGVLRRGETPEHDVHVRGGAGKMLWETR